MKRTGLIAFTFVFYLLTVCTFCHAGNPRVIIRTNFGDIALELYPEDAPITVDNFIQYVEDGFYNGLIIHRAINNFMIQGGSYETIQTWPGLAKRLNGLRDPIPNESNNGLLSKEPPDESGGISGLRLRLPA